MSWLALPIRRDADVVAVRARVRALAAALPVSEVSRARLATAASELARWCAGAPDGAVAFGWSDTPRGPYVAFSARAAPAPEVTDLVARLASGEVRVGVVSPPAGSGGEGAVHRVELGVLVRAPDDIARARGALSLPPPPPASNAPAPPDPEALRALLLQGDDATAIEMLREQNRAMARLLEDLRAREEELAGALEQARRAANEAAESALRLSDLARRKDEVLAIVSHDIRSPLAAVRGALSMLQGSLGELDPDQKRLIDIAKRAGDNIVELISNVLTSALIDAGDFRYEPGVVDLSALANDLVATLDIPASQKSLRLAAEVDAEARVLGETTWLRQVVSNLVMNAIKFTDRGGTVTVRVKTGGEERGAVRLEVADTGVGIPTEKRAQVFEKLRKLRAGGTAGERGTGLGLYITKKLVDQMGGSIDFDSVEGQGTTFRVKLPAAE